MTGINKIPSADMVFIVNPGAGQGKGLESLTEKIEQAAQRAGQRVAIYRTAGPGDGERFAREFTALCLEAASASPVTVIGAAGGAAGGAEKRLYACGGDGTFNEVLNGVLAAAGESTGPAPVSVGIIPTGTGNDFVRNFPEAGDFFDMDAQLSARPVVCDAIRYEGVVEGMWQRRYCANMFNVGFDCNVVDKAAHLKRYPLVSGSLAYLLAVAVLFAQKKGANLKVEAGGEVIHDGKLLLTAIAGGGYCGGGVHSAPQASLSDGLMDVSVIYDVTRRQFLRKFPHYAKGTHLTLPDVDDVFLTCACKTARLTPKDGPMRLCVDGEIYWAETVDFAVAPGVFRFLVPAAG